MKTLLTTGLLGLSLATAACGPEPRYAIPTPTSDARFNSRFATLEIVEVTLPTYAATEEIYAQDAAGAIEPLGPLWADDPARGITLDLSRALTSITGATAAPEPWPFRDFAAARVDVRFTQMLATAANDFRMSGQYFVAPENDGRNRSSSFDIVIPMAENAGPATIAAARGRAVQRLAEEIARNGLR